jgi:hypothetical protein
MKTVPFARAREYQPPNPDRTAYRIGTDLAGDVTFKEWPSRAAMLRMLDRQAKRASHSSDWHDYTRSHWGESRRLAPARSLRV